MIRSSARGLLIASFSAMLASSLWGAPLAITTAGSLGTFSIGQDQVTLNASGGSGTYTWTLASGALPTGLNIAPIPGSSPVQTGLVGIASAPGNYAFSLTVNDGSTSVTQPFTAKITALTVKDTSLPDAFLNTPYSYTFTPLNNAGPATFTITAPALPAGLTLSPGGVLSGTVTSPGTYNINFSVSDGVDTIYRGNQVQVYTVDLTTPGALPNATRGSAYSATLTASGGAGGYQYAITGGGLPSGLTLSSGGVLSGTTNVNASLYSFNVTITDSANNSYQKTMAIDVLGSTSQIQVTLGTLDDVVVGDGYGWQIPICCGGTAPFTWTATGLPAGMSIRFGSGVTSDYVTPGYGEIWGVPNTPGTYNVTVTVTDSLGASASLAFPFHVSILSLAPYYNLPNGTVNTAYSTTFQIIGGSAPYSVAQINGLNGSLPNGITLNTAAEAMGDFTVAGTPTENGGFDPLFEVTDGSGNTLIRNSYFNINNVPGGITINNNGNVGFITVGGNYSNQLSACCVANYAWSVAGGSLPSGMTLSASGVLSGAPTTAGTYTFLVEAADAAHSAAPGFRQFTINVTPMSITTNSLPYGNVQKPYSTSFTATGGTGALTWSVIYGGYAPPGLSLSANGTLSGTPTETGQYFFGVSVADQNGHTATGYFGLSVYAAGAFPPVSVPGGPDFGTWHLGTQWVQLGANGGDGTYMWKLVSGTLPTGLALRTDVPSFFGPNQQAGLIGVATTPGVYNFTLSVTSAGQTVSQAFTIKFSKLDLQDATPPDAFVNTPFSYAFTPIGNAGPVVFTVNSNSTNGALPPGLSLSSSGVLSGTPTTPGNYFISMNIFDGVDNQGEGYNLDVYAVNITTPGTLPNGTQNSSYSTNLAAIGGSGGYTFSLQGGLPNGLNLSANGTISGTINTGPGNYGFAITATDSNGSSYTKNMALDVLGSPVTLIDINNFQLNDPTLGDHYGSVVSACCGGTAPFTWNVTGLPPGLTTEANSNSYLQYGSTPGGVQIYGVPQQVGTYSPQFTITDATGASSSITIPMNVSVLDVAFPNGSAYNLPNGTIDVPYGATFHVLGGIGPYTFSKTTGELPDGLSINSGTLTVSGTPLENGNFYPGFLFADSGGDTLFRSESIFTAGVASSTIGINGDGFDGFDLGSTPVGASYSAQFSACCAPSYVWSVGLGSHLPAGLSLSASGQLSGTPTAPGTYTFLIAAASSTNAANVGVKSFALTVTPISITTPSLPYGNVGAPYSVSLAATGGTGALTWTQMLAYGSLLPPGLTLSSAGTISGTPTSGGAYNIILEATDTSGNTAIRGFGINIYAANAGPPVTIANGPNITLSLGTQSFGLGANGGNETYTWSVVAGTLPPGLALRTDVPSFFGPNQQAGLIGVASTPGTYNFTLSVTSAGQTTSQAFAAKISKLTLQDVNPPDAFVNTAFGYSFTPIGNAGPVTFTVNNNSTNGAMPPGLSLSSAGVLSGTPTAAGSYEIAMNIFDGVDTLYEQYELYIYAVNITTPGALPNGTQNSAYSTNLAASGGSGGYTFSLQGGLPNGLNLSANGTISGTITGGPGNYGFSITATDSNHNSYTKYMALDVVASPVAPMRITNLILDDPVLGDRYGVAESVCCGGTAPFTWNVTGLPPGLTTEANSNSSMQYSSTPGGVQVYGVPQQAGTFNVQFTVTDTTGASTSATLPMHVSSLDVAFPNGNGYNFPNGTINVAYSTAFRVLGGSGPYTLSQTNGELPDGLSTTSSTLTVSGTPLENGNFYPGFLFADSAGNTLFRYEGISIAGGASTTIGINNNGYDGYDLGTTPVGVSYSTQFSACCVASYVWSVVSGSNLPPGLSLSASGQLSGTPTTPGTYTFLIDAASSTNAANVGVKSFVLTVTPISITTSSLPYGVVGAAYSSSLAATGGTGALTWTQTFTDGSLLPPGLTLSSTGTISGTPTSAGAYNVTVQATDKSGNIAFRGYTIDIYQTAPPLNLPVGPNLGSYGVGPNQLSFQLSATGGIPPYHYSLTPGTPAILGLRVQDGPPLPTNFPASVTGGILALLGPGTYNTSVRVTDSTGATFDQAINFKVLPVDISGYQGTIPRAVVNTPYSFQVTPYGGSGAYVWTLSSAPSWLTVSSTGLLSGTPTSAGTFSFSVGVADVAGGGSVSRGETLIVSPFAITDSQVLPAATALSAYSHQFSAPNCGTNCTWSLYISSLPAGFTVSSSGLLSGTFTSAAGSETSFSIQASGSAGVTQKEFTLRIQPTVPGSLSITNGNIGQTSLTLGVDAAIALTAAGGIPPYKFTLASGTLPPGMSLAGPGETIGDLQPGFTYFVGRPMTPGNYNFTIKVTDSANNTASQPFSVLVSIMEVLYNTLPISGNPLIYNTPYSQQMLVIGGTGNYTSWTTSAPIYPGLSVNAATGLISGTPAATGLNGTLWTVTDSAGNTVTNGVLIFAASESQAITFGALSNQPLGSSPPPLSANASSGLGVTFTSNSTSVCTVSGVNIMLVGAGTCSITASQSGNADYAAATAVTQTFTVGTSALPAFFNGEVSLGSGVYYLQFPDNVVFGYYNFPANSIFYHYDMGFEAFIPGSGADVYLYDFTSSHWWYTSSILFPYLYDFTLGTWIYYFPNTNNPGHYTTNPRSFSNLTTGTIFSM